MHHVVVVASKLSANGKLSEDTRRCRLMSWGKGAAGQLGTEVPRDCNKPQVQSPFVKHPSRTFEPGQHAIVQFASIKYAVCHTMILIADTQHV